MSKRKAFLTTVVLAAWSILVLPLWLIGVGYEGRGFRLPTIGSDRIADLLIFYVPILIAVAMMISAFADRNRTRRASKRPVR